MNKLGKRSAALGDRGRRQSDKARLRFPSGLEIYFLKETRFVAFTKSCLAALRVAIASVKWYNSGLHRWLIISQGFFAVLPMMGGELVGKFGSCVASVAGFSRLGRTTGATLKHRV